MAPHLPLSISYEVLPEIKEYERTSTTVINAYVMPIVATYLHGPAPAAAMRPHIPARLLLMQSNGGLTTDAAAAERPMNIIESGPGRRRGRCPGAGARWRLAKIITFDMGGTTAKASIVEDGQADARARIRRRRRHHGRLAAADGCRLQPEGAGDRPGRSRRAAAARTFGSTPAARLQVGPESAGASPGPVCYDAKAATVPTITDANVILGFHQPQTSDRRRPAAQCRAGAAPPSRRSIAKPLGHGLDAAAYGAHQIAASNMIRAIKAGLDRARPRSPTMFALFAFGGNGPLFACGMAGALGIGA